MNSKTIRLLVILASVTLFAAGCTTTRQFIPLPASSFVPADNARIIVTRPSKFECSLCPVEIQDNGHTVGRVGLGGSLTWDRPAGRMKLDAQDTFWKRVFESLQLPVKAGHTYTVTVDYDGLHRRLLLQSEAPLSVQGKQLSTALRESDTMALSSEWVGFNTVQSEPQRLPQAPLVQTSTIERGEHWAVVIGISKYKDSRVPDLRYGESDAIAFYRWLISQNGGRYAPARVKLLVGDNASAQNIRGALFQWLNQAIEEDVVTIFFAGHGSPESPDSADNLYLLPHDVDYENIPSTAFPMWDIETALKRHIKAKRAIIIADACHSGGVGQPFDTARRAGRGLKLVPISSGLQALSQVSEGICVISASDDKQMSQEGKQWGGGHGVFTYYLLRGLKGGADTSKDGKVSLGELLLYLSQEVRRATKNAQSPTVAGKFDPAMAIGR